MNAYPTMEGVPKSATIRLEASPVPATLATLLVQMQDHVWVSEHNYSEWDSPEWNSKSVQEWFMIHVYAEKYVSIETNYWYG